MYHLNQAWRTLTEPCHKAAKAVGSYLDALHKAALLPHDLEFIEHSCDVLRKSLDLSMSGDLFCYKASCPCKSDAVFNTPRRLQQENESIRKQQMTFICIDCLKTDGESKKTGACRLSHA